MGRNSEWCCLLDRPNDGFGKRPCLACERGTSSDMVFSPKVWRLCPPLPTWVYHVASKHQHAPCFTDCGIASSLLHTRPRREWDTAITWPVLGAERLGRLRHSYDAFHDGGWLGGVRRHKGTCVGVYRTKKAPSMGTRLLCSLHVCERLRVRHKVAGTRDKAHLWALSSGWDVLHGFLYK